MHQRIGIMGGTFNPIHFGHLAAAEEIRERLNLDKVLFIPSFIPPHKQEEQRPTAAQRREMVLLALRSNPLFGLSDIELQRGGTSYTVDTIRALRSLHPESALFFITGLDSFLEIQTWHQWHELLGSCAFVILSRPGYRFSDLMKLGFMKPFEAELASLGRESAHQVHILPSGFDLHLAVIPQYDISSTDIRRRVREGRSIKYLLPEPVEHYIIANKLYA